MRTGYLVAAVMLFASGGAAFAQSLDGVAEVTAAGGGANISARAAARIERRDDRRERRAAQLNALRTARGLQARGDAAAGAFAATGENSFEAASESAARLMFTAEDEAQPTDSDAPAGNEADPDDSPREKPIFYILPYVEGDADIQGDLVECYEDCEEPHPGDEETHATDRPYIYTLSNTDSEVFFRGNARHSAGAGLGLFQPLDQLSGPSGDPFAFQGTATLEGSVNYPAVKPERAAEILARRLAQIDCMRDRALAEGNAALLETADMLEASARARFEAAGSATVGTTTDSPETGAP